MFCVCSQWHLAYCSCAETGAADAVFTGRSPCCFLQLLVLVGPRAFVLSMVWPRTMAGPFPLCSRACEKPVELRELVTLCHSGKLLSVLFIYFRDFVIPGVHGSSLQLSLSEEVSEEREE